MNEYKPKPIGAKKIRKELEKGVTDPKQIATNIGYKLSTVKHYIALYFSSKKIRTCKHEKTSISATTKFIIDELKAGKRQAEIARAVGVSRQRVSWVKKQYLEVKQNGRKETDG